jgi:hypothetical protein
VDFKLTHYPNTSSVGLSTTNLLALCGQSFLSPNYPKQAKQCFIHAGFGALSLPKQASDVSGGGYAVSTMFTRVVSDVSLSRLFAGLIDTSSVHAMDWFSVG